MDIFLFTYFFPYSKSEPFVINEYEYMKKNSRSVTVLSLYGKPEEIIPDIKTGVSYSASIFKNASAKKRSF